jgi:hypothetical protein
MKTKKTVAIICVIIGAIILFAAADWVCILQKAHSTFENYYAFRGCKELLSKTDDAGYCRTASGQTIKIVKFQGKWFLDGDLPCGFLCF